MSEDVEKVSVSASVLAGLGASKGGKARAARLTPEERRSIAQRAAQARWGGGIRLAPYPGKINLGDIEIVCAVLEDGTRVLNQSTFLRALGREPGKGRRSIPESEEVRPPFLAANNLQPFLTAELRELAEPIRYRSVDDPNITWSWGYRAELLPLVCEAYLQAEDEGVLLPSQRVAYKAASVLIRGIARVGIVALVDEATGYQEVRARDALAKILETYIARELQPWVSTFPAEYYSEMFRLRGLDYPRSTVRRPRYFGTLTNDIVYRRIAPGVLDELKRVQMRDDEGRPKHKLFQKLTSNAGYPKLVSHLGSVVTLMKLSHNWGDFQQKLDRIHPRFGDTVPLPFDDDTSNDTGSGL